MSATFAAPRRPALAGHCSVALSERRTVSLGRRRRRKAASIAIGMILLALAPNKIGYQDLGALLARQPAVAERWQQHLIASPFGTIHTAVFKMPTPIGSDIPHASIYALANFDPADIRGSIGRPLDNDATAPSQFPKPDRTAKADSLISRPRAPMPPLAPDIDLPYADIRPASRTSAALNTPVLAPIAFVRFCARYPEDCKRRSTEVDRTPVPLTRARLAELSKVNHEVNLSIKPQENRAGVLAEQWLVAPGRGDCNDYAVTKRHELLARGWPSHSLLLAEVVVASGEHHLVLVVRTRENDLVLDNLNWDVRPASQIDYQWIRAQQAENPKFWSKMNVARVDRLAMDAR